MVECGKSGFKRNAFYWLLLLFFYWHGNAVAAQRVALIIGNGAYQNVPGLANPGNDAVDMAAKLDYLGFDVVRGTDTNLGQLKSRVRQFSQKLRGAEVALFYYSGHAIQLNDDNYLVPTDATLATELDVDLETLALQTVLRQMEAQAKVNLVFLDACRDNPFLGRMQSNTRNVAATRGLSRVDSGPIGSVIVFATAPGDVALDGVGRNSPFTKAVLEHIDTPGQDISIMLRKVRADVANATDRRQIPWERNSLTEAFVFSTPLPAEKTGRFSISGVPKGGRICFLLDGSWLCNSNIELPMGQTYDVFASAPGYDDWQSRVRLNRDRQVLTVSLVSNLDTNPPEPLQSDSESRQNVALQIEAVQEVDLASKEVLAEKEKKAYQDAYDLLISRKNTEAIDQFERFINLFPDGAYIDNAHYWLGEASYVERRFNQAIAQFDTVISDFPSSRKVGDAMLRKGFAYFEIQDYDKARAVLDRVQSQYAGRSIAALARRRIEQMDNAGL